MSSLRSATQGGVAPAMLGGRYRVLGFLGAGAMATVYEVEDPDGERHAAKLFAHMPEGSLAGDALVRFLRESRFSDRIDSPHVVRVTDAAIDEELHVPYFIMPRINGTSLDTVLERLGPLHPVVATRIVLQACEGIEAAHARGIVHRDIKPSNLLLDHLHDNSIVVRVCDFGVAKWPEGGEALTQTGSMLGTPLYMAPEQALNAKDADVRVDVWSVAMTLYHALAGHPAYERVGGFGGLLLAIANRDVPPLQECAPWVESSLARVVHGGLVRDRDARCPDIDALKTALMPHARGTSNLRAEHLAPIPAELRARVETRAPMPRAWSHNDESAPHGGADCGSVPVVPDAFEGTSLLDRYKIKRLIGRGGMAAVYEAEAADGTAVAVKVLLDTAGGHSAEMKRRLVREARALKAIDSPYVVRVVDADTHERAGAPFIVMELLQGTDLEHLVQKWGALTPEPVVRLFTQLCRGLARAHAQGLVHRDVKPANLFLHHILNGEVVPKICDFGIAKQHLFQREEDRTVELTRTGGIIGSPLYMSPEQAQSSKHVDHRTDIWSLGLSLWEALSGHRPWEEYKTVGELIVAICTVPMKPLLDVAPWIDPRLAEIVHRCLAKSREDRFPDANSLAAALEPFAYPSARLHRNLLVPVPMGQRLIRAATPGAQAMSRPGSLDPAASTHHSNATTGNHAPRARNYIAVGAVVVVALAAGLWGFRQGQADTTAVVVTHPVRSLAAPQREAASAAASSAANAWLRIDPPSAIVNVDGKPTAVTDGGVALSGSVGATVRVEARNGIASTSTSVELTLDGPVPNVVRVPGEVSSSDASAGVRHAPGVVVPTAPAATAATSSPSRAVPTPSAVDHAIDTPPPVIPKDEWQ